MKRIFLLAGSIGRGGSIGSALSVMKFQAEFFPLQAKHLDDAKIEKK